MSPALISTDNLQAGYGGRAVLRNVTLEFSGPSAGLVGPNGAGKSTFLKTLLGFIPPLSGRATVLDMPVPARAIQVRSRVGYMPETEAFIPGMNAVNFVAYMAQLSGLPRGAAMERSHEVLQYVGLGESRYRNIETYSMGMKQRAKLAQAIVHDPTLLFLDEPTNGMDPQGRIEMLELVSDLAHNKGMSVVLCSHLLKDVETVADEIIVMGNGQVLSKRMKESFDTARATIYEVRLRGNAAAFSAAVRESGCRVAASEVASNVRVQLEPGEATDVIFEAAARTGCVVQRLERQDEKLEDVFIKALSELGDAHL